MSNFVKICTEDPKYVGIPNTSFRPLKLIEVYEILTWQHSYNRLKYTKSLNGITRITHCNV